MPAPAAIPAPIAYIKVVAVKKLVVEFLVRCFRPGGFGRLCAGSASAILLDRPTTALRCVVVTVVDLLL